MDTGGVPSLDLSLTEAARRRRRRRRLTVVTGLTAVAALMVVASLVTSSGANPSKGASSVDRSRKAVMAALHLASAERTADVGMHMTIEGGGQLLTIIGTGSIDIDSQAAEFGMSVTDGSATTELKMIYLGGRAYEAIPELPRLEPGKYWVSLDPAGTGNGSGQEPSALGVGGDPLTLLSLLQLQSTSVEQTGTAGAAGTADASYLVTVAPDDISKLASQGDLPPPLQLLARAPVSSLSAQVYIDRAGRLNSDSITIGITEPDPVTMTDYLDFSNYGISITVKAPPASTVITYQQLMQDLGNRQGLII